MDPGKVLLVVGITLIVVILFNVIIYLSARGDRTHSQIEMFKRATKRIRNPWQVEDSMLEELSKRASELKEQTGDLQSREDE